MSSFDPDGSSTCNRTSKGHAAIHELPVQFPRPCELIVSFHSPLPAIQAVPAPTSRAASESSLIFDYVLCKVSLFAGTRFPRRARAPPSFDPHQYYRRVPVLLPYLVLPFLKLLLYSFFPAPLL